MTGEGEPKPALETPATKSSTNVTHRGDGLWPRHRPHPPNLSVERLCARGRSPRREAARRSEPLACGRRDPQDDRLMPPSVGGPSTFGLTADELRRHANDLHRRGWSVADITQVLDVELVSR